MCKIDRSPSCTNETFELSGGGPCYTPPMNTAAGVPPLLCASCLMGRISFEGAIVPRVYTFDGRRKGRS